MSTANGVTHAVTAHEATLIEVATTAVVQTRDEGWTGTLSPGAVLRVEVQLPPVLDDMPLQTLERWANGPSVSPKEKLLQQPFRK